jgi:alpha-amylase/alpha-mannosidase (GH57 family)
VDDPNVLCQPYRAEEGGHALSVFFRDTPLSDAIGFHYYAYGDYEQAARDFIREIKSRFATPISGDDDRMLTVVLDGENAWGAFRDDARPFLHALYSQIETDAEIETVTFDDYLSGSGVRGLAPHPLETQAKVFDLFTGSWIDENGSAPGVDLGTWVGEAEENQGWVLLGQARDFLAALGATPQTAPAAFEALYMAEGSDWFWWFGGDQDSGNDQEFDDLFRLHLKNIYRAVGAEPPPELDHNIVPHSVVWTFTRPAKSVQPHDRVTVRTNCPGVITWHLDDGQPQSSNLAPVGGVMAGVQRYQWTLGSVALQARELVFRFRCTHPRCDGNHICCRADEHTVRIVPRLRKKGLSR